MGTENYQKLKSLLYHLLEIDPAMEPDEVSQDTVKLWDSAKHLNIIMEVEALFGVSFKIADVTEMRSFEDIVACLQRHGVAL